MSTENTLDTTSSGGTSVENTSSNVDTSSSSGINTSPSSSSSAPSSDLTGGLPPVKEALPIAAGAPVIPAYTPNFKYKAALQEKELDPFFRDLVKDADSEKKVKDVFSRADAFDYMKTKYESRDKEFGTLQTDYQNQSAVVQRVNEAKSKGDLDTVFRNVGLNDHQVIQWAAKRVDYLQMMNGLPPEQREAIQQQEQAQIQNQSYQEQMSQMQTDLQSQRVQNRTIMLDQAMSRQDVSQAAGFWDNKMGNQGAFKDMVVEEAQREWYMNKVDLSPEQAVQKVMQRFGKFIDVQNAGSQDSNAFQNQPQAPQMPQSRPIIPAVPGSSKTPIKRQYKSLDELKARAKELEVTP